MRGAILLTRCMFLAVLCTVIGHPCLTVLDARPVPNEMAVKKENVRAHARRAPLTPDQQRLAETGMAAARRATLSRATAVASVCGISLDDVSQEAFLACCNAARTFQLPGDFPTYAAITAVNHLKDLLKAAGRACRAEHYCQLLYPEHVPARKQPQVEQRRARGRLHLRAALATLTTRQRQVAELRAMGTSWTEVAKELGVGVDSARNSLRQAARKLKKALEA